MLQTIAHLSTIPLVHICLLFFLALAFLVFNKRTSANAFFILGFVWLLITTQFSFSASVMNPLEHGKSLAEQKDYSSTPNAIAVMACNYYDVDEFPTENRWPTCSFLRLFRAASLYNKKPMKIIVSGGNFGDWQQPYSHYAKLLLQELGVAKNDIVEVPHGYDTESEIKAIISTPNLFKAPLILITSASHVNRVEGYFQLCGIDVIPSPTDYLTKPNIEINLGLPSADSMTILKRAFHEYLGAVEFRVKNLLGAFENYC